jgi:thiol:disulfide interchange protein DsbA
MRQALAMKLSGVVTLLSLLLTMPEAGAQNIPYFIIERPEKVSTTNKIEVAEVFSYACSYCAQFQPLIDAWRKKLDTKKVEFVYVPAPYDARDTLLARGYFAAEKLGAVDKTHHAIFDAIRGGLRVQTFQDVRMLYTQLGVSPTEFDKAASGFDIETKSRRTLNLMIQYKIDSTPTLIVDGKYRITAASAGSLEGMIKVADELIKSLSSRSPAQTTATSRQAPSNGK